MKYLFCHWRNGEYIVTVKDPNEIASIICDDTTETITETMQAYQIIPGKDLKRVKIDYAIIPASDGKWVDVDILDKYDNVIDHGQW